MTMLTNKIGPLLNLYQKRKYLKILWKKYLDKKKKETSKKWIYNKEKKIYMNY